MPWGDIDWYTVGLAATGLAFVLFAAFMVWHAMRPDTQQAIWSWTWPLLAVVALWATVITWLRASPFIDDKIETYASALVYVGLGSCTVVAMMLVLTRRWTVLALGMLATMTAIAYWETTTAALVKDWVEFTPYQLEWSNDGIISGLIVGITLAGIGMIQNVLQGGPPVQLSRLRWSRLDESRVTRVFLVAVISLIAVAGVTAAIMELP